MGCKKKKRILEKTKGSLRSVVPLESLLAFVTFFLCLSTWISAADASMYIPASPQGPQHGFVNINYPYEITTMNENASWLFDWGDGTTSNWLRLQNASTSILQTHQWSHEGAYLVKVLFRSSSSSDSIWSDPLMVVIASVTAADFPAKPVLTSGPVEGLNGSMYTYAVTATDPHGNRVRCRCDWGDTKNLSAWTSLGSIGGTVVLTHRWNSSGNYSLRFQSSNEYGLNSSWSTPVSVVIRTPSETNQSVTNLLLVNGITDFLIYHPDHTGVFLNTTSGASTPIVWRGEGIYYLDDDNDGHWDYSYNPSQGLIEPLASPMATTIKTSQFQVPWLLIFIIVGIVVGVVAILVVLVKTGYLYVYEEVVEKK